MKKLDSLTIVSMYTGKRDFSVITATVARKMNLKDKTYD